MAVPAGTAVVALTGDTKGLDAAIAAATAKVGSLGTGVQRSTQGATAGVGNLREAFRSLAVQATGLNPQMARVVDVLGLMSVGSTVMVGALAGIAALSGAWRMLTSSQREAAESLEAWVDQMGKAADLRAMGGPTVAQGRAAIVRKGDLELERSAFQALADAGDEVALARVQRLTREIDELTKAIEEGGRMLQDQRRNGTSPAGAGGRVPSGFVVPSGFLASTFAPLQFGGASGPSPFAMGGGGGPGGIFQGAGLGLARSGIKGSGFVGDVKTKDLASGIAATAKSAAAASRSASSGASGFANAGAVVVDTLSSMAQAAITGSNSMASAITGALQSIVSNIQTKGGGLFGSTLPGALIGAGIGIIGSFFGGGRDRAPVPVRVSNVDEFARAQERPVQVRLNLVTPEGQTIEQYEYLLQNRAARDGVPRRTGPR